LMLTFKPGMDSLVSDREQIVYKYCKNKGYDVCNWVIEINDPNDFCQACQLNRTIPNLSQHKNFDKWKKLEIAKHRLIYQLQRLGLPVQSKAANDQGFCFDFVAKLDNKQLMTGHANGVITVLLKEADSVQREQIRMQLREPYRTLIGHLRHEIGHHYWDRIVRSDSNTLDSYRSVFGNERLGYSDSLKKYYAEGPPTDWQTSFISKYATAHPWEDWAETWAHYLHVMDMVETAYFFGLTVSPTSTELRMETKVSCDPYTVDNFDTIVQTCVPLSFAVNSINRAMGLPDVYPFVITAGVIEKMKFIHQLLLPYRGTFHDEISL
jgi:hypothetical protein